MAKIGLEAKIGSHLEAMISFRDERNASDIQKTYQVSIKRLNKMLDLAIKEAETNPEIGIAVARRCSRSVLEGMSDLVQAPARANSLRKYDILEHYLALELIRK